MKRNALVAFGLLVSLVSAGAVFGKEVKSVNSFAVAKKFDITIEQARKNALKKVPGEIEDEYTLEDEDGNLTAYVFVIKAASNGKSFDVQIDAQNGNVLAANQQEEEETESEEEEEEEVEEEVEEDDSTEPETVEDDSTETETETEEVDSTETETEDESDVNVDVDDSDDASMNDEENAAQPKVSIEQARAKALKKAKGEIQEEALVTDDGNAYYSFKIKGKKDKMTEVRVDANSGKAKKIKAPKSE